MIMQVIANLVEAGLSHVSGREEGQGLIEYSLIAALISVVCIVIMTTVGGDIVTVFTNLSTAL
jgi:pilus assembly protein Flp/PilA